MRRYELDMEALDEWERTTKLDLLKARFAVLIDCHLVNAYHPRQMNGVFDERDKALEWAKKRPSDAHARVYERDTYGRPLWRRVKP